MPKIRPYGALVRKLINWLTVKTGEGDLYEIDTALRPNGSSGLLVTSFEAYSNYQQQRGSNTAWTWEHQAMTRARCVLGDATLHSRFDAVREAVIGAERATAGLRQEIGSMRAKVRASHPVRGGEFDVKHSPGGMVDIEFAVQYLVLSHGRQHPELLSGTRRISNVAPTLFTPRRARLVQKPYRPSLGFFICNNFDEEHYDQYKQTRVPAIRRPDGNRRSGGVRNPRHARERWPGGQG